MEKKKICPECGSNNTMSIGHGGYKQGKNGFGDKTVMIAYQCKDCSFAWSE
jgi:DNA-directed RNA polymerase subunit M/transcription elongation factor TFIIS